MTTPTKQTSEPIQICTETNCIILSSFTCVLVFIIWIYILISTQPIDYYEVAFKKDTITNVVDTETVYESGRHFWGFFTSAIKFPRLYQKINLNELSVSDKKEKTFLLDITFFYRLPIDSLKYLYEQFGINYLNTIESIATSIVKNMAPNYDLEDYLKIRDTISSEINKNLTRQLETIWVEVEQYKFTLNAIKLEQATIDKYLTIAVQLQTNARQEYEQDAQVIRQNTTKFVEEINGEILKVQRNANAETTKIVNIANSESREIIESARNLGISETMNDLGINDIETRKKFIQYMALLENPTIKLVPENINVLTQI